MINITGNKSLDLFIMQSDENKQRVIHDCGYYFQGDLIRCIYSLGLHTTDFTDSDWRELERLYGID